jgi:hypothetical protein
MQRQPDMDEMMDDGTWKDDGRTTKVAWLIRSSGIYRQTNIK